MRKPCPELRPHDDGIKCKILVSHGSVFSNGCFALAESNVAGLSCFCFVFLVLVLLPFCSRVRYTSLLLRWIFSSSFFSHLDPISLCCALKRKHIFGPVVCNLGSTSDISRYLPKEINKIEDDVYLETTKTKWFVYQWENRKGLLMKGYRSPLFWFSWPSRHDQIVVRCPTLRAPTTTTTLEVQGVTLPASSPLYLGHLRF